LLIELRERTVRQAGCVVRDLDHRRSVESAIFEEARHARVQDAETVLAALDLEERL